MFHTYRPENVIGDFQKNNRFMDGRDLLARMIIDRGQHYFEIRGSDRQWKWKRYRVDCTIGSKWQQAYATRLPNGQIHVLPIQYNMLRILAWAYSLYANWIWRRFSQCTGWSNLVLC